MKSEKIFLWSTRLNVFIAGAIVMALEITGSRILAPYFGNSLSVWGSLIGVVLTGLSLGYYLGGRLADRNPNFRTFSLIIFYAGISILFIPFVSSQVLNLITNLDLGERFSSLLATTLLLAFPTVMLGMVSPYAIKLSTKNLNKLGNIAGNLYALSTLGSIFGTFFSVFYLIPEFGVKTILLSFGIILMVVSIMGLGLRFKLFLISALILSFLPLNMIVPKLFSHTGNVIYEKETPYSHLDVVDSKGTRTLYLNGLSHSAMYLNNTNDLVFLYTEMFNLAFAFNSNIQNVLFIGGGGFSTPKYFLENYPDMIVDVVEIDPDVIKVAKDYFNLKEDTRLSIYNRDGRVYITNSNKKYDLIVLDAYSKTYVPFHLMTKEFFMELKKDLTPDGIVASNMITSLLGDTSDLFKAEYKTISQIFSNLYVFPTRANSPGTVQNVLLFASQTSYLSKDRLAENLHSINMSEFINYIENYYENAIYLEDAPVLTDDYAPVETLLNPVTEKPYQIEYRYQLYF